MKDKNKHQIFLDSNIILYAYSNNELNKNEIANNLIFSNETVIISIQVINEITNILYKKFNLTSKIIEKVLLEIDNNLIIVNFELTTQIKALKIKEKYNFSYYDSLIIATALENSCSVLYTEDMQHNQLIDNKLRIRNPFI